MAWKWYDTVPNQGNTVNTKLQYVLYKFNSLLYLCFVPPIPFDLATHPTEEETYIALLEAVLRHAEGGEALAHRVEDGGRDLGRIRPLLHL